MLVNKLLLLFYVLTVTGCILSSEAYTDPFNEITFPAKENGTCYKRVLYNDALLANISMGLVQISPGSQQAGVKTKSSRGWVTIIDCCVGYVRNNETGNCEAHCEDECIGGTCTGPNTCSCEEGWRLESSKECKPVCRRGCKEHAYCFAPDVCSCEFGYQDVDGVCRPVCLHDCENGDCLEPRVCRCHPGYKLNNETKMCEPVCERGCKNGNCTAPGVCACDDGYVNHSYTQGTCVPDCPDTCTNGFCDSPMVCTCNEGYESDANGSCVPHCKSGCPNGQCIAPEQCLCFPGFVKDPVLKECVEFKHQTLYESNVSNNNRYGSNVHVKSNQHQIYTSTDHAIPVIGLNATNKTEKYYSPRTRTDKPSRIFEFQQNHESQNHESQNHETPILLYNTPTSTPIQNFEDSDRYTSSRVYENHYGQKNFAFETHRVTQNPRPLITLTEDPNIDQTIELQRTMNVHKVNYIPEARIVITPHSVPSVTCRSDCQDQTHRTFAQIPREPVTRDYQDPPRTSSPPYRQSYVKINNSPDRLDDDQFHVNPELNQFTDYRRENITVEIDRYNISENLAPNHSHRDHNKQAPCDSVSIEDQETDWYDKSAESQNRPYDPILIDDTEAFKSRNSLEGLCRVPCINGRCIGLNTCECKSGYALDPRVRNRNVCVPVCPNGCLNGVCSAPNMCICKAGFVKEYGNRDSHVCITHD